MKKLFVPGALLAVTVVGALILHSCKKSQSYTFEMATVKKSNIVNTVDATGTLEAITSVVVGTQVSGIVEKLYVDFNSPVKKGQIIAELEKVTLKSQVDQALASLESAKAEREYQESNFERSKALYEKNLIAKADFDQAKYSNAQSNASLKTAQASYDRALVNLGYATIYSPIDGVVMNRAVDEGQTVAASFNTPEIFTIAKDLKEMQVEADIDESDIGMIKVGQRVDFEVDAFPDDKFTGTVEQIRMNPVTTSTVVTYTVIINAPNPEQKLLPGMTANIIIYVEEVKDVLTVPYKAVKFTPDSDYMAEMFKEMMKKGGIPGMPANGKMPAGAGRSSMASGTGMPSQGSAAAPQGMPSGQMPSGGFPAMGGSGFGGTRVWVKGEKGIRPVPVVLGASDGDNAEVKSGLKEGDEVITKMTKVSGAEKKQKTATSNPFMPQRPGGNQTRRTTTSNR